MLRRSVSLLWLFNFVFLTFISGAYTWGPVTHYHINKQAKSDFEYQEIYASNGTGPDMSVLIGFPFVGPPPVGEDWDWADFLHSPDPKEEEGGRSYWSSPNFAYLTLKVAGFDAGISSKNEAYGLGWGGHIAADWVAHNDNLFPISPGGSNGEKLHLLGETAYDLYAYDTRGSIAPFDYEFPFKWKIKFNPSLIYKALANYRLISIYEDNTRKSENISDQDLKEKALDTTLSKEYIQKLSTWFARSNAIIQASYKITLEKMGLAGREAFREKMRDKGAEENLALSAKSVSDWIEAKTPRNSIPDFDDKVIPFWSSPLSSSSVTTGDNLSFNLESFLNPFSVFKAQFALAEIKPLSTESSLEEPDAHEAAYTFWEDIANQAEAQGILQVEEQTITDDEGQEELEVTVILTDPERFEDIFRDTIQNHLQNPTSETEKRIAHFWKNLFIDGISDPDQLMDMTSPVISTALPEDKSYSPWHKPLISAAVEDDYLGIGIDEESIRMKVDGNEVNATYIPALKSVIYTPTDYLATGKHTISLKVADKAGNTSTQSWYFTVKTLFEQTLFSKSSLTINGNSRVTDTSYAGQDIVISGNSEVDGNLITAGQARLIGKSYHLEGEIKENQAPLPFPQIDFDYYEFFATNQGTRLLGETTLKTKDLKGLIFVEGNVKISQDTTSNETITATIFAAGEIEIPGDLNLNPAIDGLSLIAHDGINLSGDGHIQGALYSKNGDIKLFGNKSYLGAIYAGKNLEISGNSSIQGDQTLGK